ncbi:MAG: hypothetical protein ACLU9S_00810 [Oscillospiraceae bacterium]
MVITGRKAFPESRPSQWWPSLQHTTYNGPDYASIGKTVIGTLIPDAGYALPEVISVTMGGQATEHYTYDPAAGTVTVTQVTGDVVISGAATLIGGRTITYQLTHLTHNGPTEYVAGQDLTGVLDSRCRVLPAGDRLRHRRPGRHSVYPITPTPVRLTIWRRHGELDHPGRGPVGCSCGGCRCNQSHRADGGQQARLEGPVHCHRDWR